MAILRRIVRILKRDGIGGLLSGIRKRAARGCESAHWLVIGYRTFLDVPLLRPAVDVELKQVGPDDEADIEGLTEVDVWNIPKSATIEMMKAGWVCYVGKHEGKIVSTSWAFFRETFEEPYLKREFSLGRDECFHWRGFCIPAYRGKGIQPFVTGSVVNDIALRHGRTSGLIMVRPNNKAQLRAFAKTGLFPVGHVGFIEVLGIRFHYLWGRRAFENTKRRFFVEDVFWA